MAARTLVLGIDTSCDDTSASVVADGRVILSNVVSSQVEIHERFGGVVPELASRKHTEIITRIIDRALSDAAVPMEALSAVAVTNRPGLIGALLVGLEAAKALAYAYRLPFVPVHHIAGHVYANAMVHDVPFPHLCLTVSGGHTLLVLVREGWRFETLGSTLDDAVGEAYDKVAQYLGLGFPGGPRIDRLANENTAPVVPFPRPMAMSDDYDFSFSGLKTAVRYFMDKHGDDVPLSAVAAGFQEAAVETLVTKTFRAVESFPVEAVTLTGGVAANSALRRRLAEEGEARGIPTFTPPISLCTDNGAMIAGIGTLHWQRGEVGDLAASAYASAPLE